MTGSAGFTGLFAAMLAGTAQAQSTDAQRSVPVQPIAQIDAPDTAATVNSNIAAIQRFFEAYNRGEMNVVREVAAPDIVWRIPGHHPLAGDKQGVDEIVAFLQALGRAKFQSEVLYLGANENYVVDVHRGYSNMEGQENIDQLWALMFRFENGRIKEVVNFPSNQHAADAFFWRVYSLKPIPDRLAE
jgi:hypothetical protein